MSLARFRPQWQQTMIRIRDPAVSLPFYEALGFRLVKRLDFPQWRFSVFFVATLPPDEVLPEDGAARERYLFSMRHVTLELTHNHGTEADPAFPGYDSGNNEPKRGFGHIALHCDDVYAASATLEARGVRFRKRPDEGRMKGIAFFYDPDGYWIELVRRSDISPWRGKLAFTLAQTMLRVKDPQPTLHFYRDVLGMRLMHEGHYGPDQGDFSLFFLMDASHQEDAHSRDSHEHLNACFNPSLELTHNHGTESQPEFHYHDGNTDPRGFGHIGFLVDDVEGFFAEADKLGLRIKKRPQDGNMRNLGFLYDPDGYWVEIIQRGATVADFFGNKN